MRLLFIALTFVFFACSGSKEIVNKEDNRKKSVYDESFDPMSLNDNDIVILPNEAGSDERKVNSGEENKKSPVSEINGYRVQILATNNLEKASLAEQEAAERFKISGYITYLVFEAPLYKIRVGDCTDRVQAEKIRDLARSVGYEGAFVVKSVVVVPR